MTWENRIKHLEEGHTALDKQIDNLEKNGLYEDLHLEELKKKRLHLKDQIEKLKREHDLAEYQKQAQDLWSDSCTTPRAK
jgi:hypothetical protein